MKRLLLALLLMLAAASLAPAAHRPATDWTTAARWSTLRAPSSGPARVIGFYSAGCVQGAVPLPLTGPGYEVLHARRHRYFGHPDLIAFVERLARSAAAKELPSLLVGDLAQPRGGPTPTDHGSHQSGLDADIAYIRPLDALTRPLTPAERESVTFPPVVDLGTGKVIGEWDERIAELLELAASDAAVDRIFVHPTIKRATCKNGGSKASWIGKLRPWWGHHDHFHVRLRCPAGSADCRPQASLPSGNGCGEELAWWIGKRAHVGSDARSRTIRGGSTRRAPLPARCRQLLR